MRAFPRVRAHAGLWSLVALLAAGLVFTAAAAGPTVARLEDAALRSMIEDAPSGARDLTLGWRAPGTVATGGPTSTDVESAEAALATAREALPEVLRGAGHQSWGGQATLPRWGSLTGPGVALTNGYQPAAALRHQTGLAAEVRLIRGVAPATDPAGRVVEVMVAAAIADPLGLRVGEEYELLAGDTASGMTSARAERVAPADRLALRVVGLYTARDPAAPVWEPLPRLLTPGRAVVDADPPTHTASVELATDQAGIDLLVARQLASKLRLEASARFRLDPARIDAAWAAPATAAVALLRRSPATAGLAVETGLPALIEEFTRRAAAARAITAVGAAGVLGTAAGLLLLAAGLTVGRRRSELALLRARGGSVPGIAGRLGVEAVLVVGPAAVAGWLLQAVIIGAWRPGWPAGLAAVTALLVVPLAAVVAPSAGVRRRGGSAASRTDLVVRASGPGRLTAELVVVILAGLGVLLLHQRGLASSGTDPFLSAVPVLIAVAAGLVALRLYPWPVRLLGPIAARSRGPVGFLGLARAGRASPVTALPLLVLVLAVAVGGFAGGVYGSVEAARDTAAVAAVGTHSRVAAEGLDRAAVAAVAELPGVRAVVPVGRVGELRVGGRWRSDLVVTAIDPASYRDNLAALGLPVALPAEFGAAPVAGAPVPVLAPRGVADAGLSLEVGEVELPLRVVGEVAGLPGPEGSGAVLVPAGALPRPAPVDELLVAGAAADPAAVRAAVAVATGGSPAEVTVSTLAGHRAALAGQGFHPALRLVLVAGLVAAAVGTLLAVGLALATQADQRGRTLSLLRTMGLTPGQARGVLLIELLVPTVLAAGFGGAAGTALPALLAPALGLPELSGGGPVGGGVSPAAVGLLTGLLVAAVCGGALLAAASNRRLGLGRVLRLG